MFRGGKLTAEGFSQLRYIRACMLESQRLSPVTVGTVRILSNPIAVDGYLSVSDSKNGARLEWWVKDLYNDSYHWIRIHYQITKIILFF